MIVFDLIKISTKDFAVATIIKNCANQQSIVIIRLFVLRISLFLSGILKVGSCITDVIKYEGFKRRG